jgi:hypothetical protein
VTFYAELQTFGAPAASASVGLPRTKRILCSEFSVRVGY